MKTSLIRRLSAIGGALAMVSVVSVGTMPSASAADAFAGAGTASFPQFPCPAGCAGTASLTVAALSSAPGIDIGQVSVSFTYFERSGLTCPLSGTASGTLVGAGLAAFVAWTRDGLVALVSLTTVTLNGVAEPNGLAVLVLAPVPVPPLNQPGGCDGTATASALLSGVAIGGTL